MEPMEIGNLMYAEVGARMYVCADSEWCELVVHPPDGGHSYTAVVDSDLIRRLRNAWQETKFRGFDGIVRKHLAKKSAEREAAAAKKNGGTK